MDDLHKQLSEELAAMPLEAQTLNRYYAAILTGACTFASLTEEQQKRALGELEDTIFTMLRSFKSAVMADYFERMARMVKAKPHMRRTPIILLLAANGPTFLKAVEEREKEVGQAVLVFNTIVEELRAGRLS